jgi:2-amino-4-hydroxy-6-hydroxymethyldihydropteridine diphosphokinase
MFGPVFLGLGSNLGDRLAFLSNAVHRLAAHPLCTAIQVASVYESPAKTLDPADHQPSYLNSVLWLRTDLGPHHLMQLCQAIERDAGRIQKGGWSPRTLDIDLLAFGTMTLASPRLSVPRPHLADRRFVLEPWAELASASRIPAPFDRTVRGLLADISDPDPIHRIPESLEPALSG